MAMKFARPHGHEIRRPLRPHVNFVDLSPAQVTSSGNHDRITASRYTNFVESMSVQ